MRATTQPIPFLLLVMLLVLAGTSLPGEDITCLDGTVIRQVVSVRAKPDGITITTADGMVGVRFTNLPQALCTRYGYDPFAAGLYHASQLHRATNHRSDAYSLDQLDLARAKALKTGKCLGFILVWDTYFETEVDPATAGSANALVQFHECFQDSLVLVYVRHENQLEQAPEAARKGLMGPDEGGFAPSMAVTDPTLTDYICEIPLGGPHADAAVRMQVFRSGIERIKAYLATHRGSTIVPAAATATTASGGSAPSVPSPSPAAGDSTTVAPAGVDHEAPATAAANAQPGNSEAAAPTPVAYQRVSMSDGRVLNGHLSVDQTRIEIINLKNGTVEGTLDISPDDIQSVAKKSFTLGADAPPAKTPQEHQLYLHERAVVMSILALNQAKQLNADTLQEQLDWNRAPHKPTQDVELQAEFKAHVDSLHARLQHAKDDIPVARSAVDQAMISYRALGGTRVFTALFIEPRPPR